MTSGAVEAVAYLYQTDQEEWLSRRDDEAPAADCDFKVTPLYTRIAKTEPATAEGEVEQFRRAGCAGWYDGKPEPTDGPGQFETRTLYASRTTETEAVTALREFVGKRADECQAHAEASFYPMATREYRAKEAAFREVLAALTPEKVNG